MLIVIYSPPVPFQNGDLCISILHPPVDDPQSGELPCERWNPTQNVRTILLSVISLLNEPNTFSPANVDASVMYRRWRDSKGRDKEYENIIRWVWGHWWRPTNWPLKWLGEYFRWIYEYNVNTHYSYDNFVLFSVIFK